MSLSEASIQFLGGILTQPLWKGFASNYGLPFRSTQQTEWGFIWRLSQIGERRTSRDKSWIDFHFTRRCSTWEAPQQILRISLSCLFHVWNFSYLSWNTADPHHHHHSHSYVSIEVIITITIIAIRQNLHHDTWQCWNWILFWTGLVWWNISWKCDGSVMEHKPPGKLPHFNSADSTSFENNNILFHLNFWPNYLANLWQ